MLIFTQIRPSVIPDGHSQERPEEKPNTLHLYTHGSVNSEHEPHTHTCFMLGGAEGGLRLHAGMPFSCHMSHRRGNEGVIASGSACFLLCSHKCLHLPLLGHRCHKVLTLILSPRTERRDDQTRPHVIFRRIKPLISACMMDGPQRRLPH